MFYRHVLTLSKSRISLCVITEKISSYRHNEVHRVQFPNEMTTTLAPAPKLDLTPEDYFQKIAVAYWQKLVRAGVPKQEAQAIAAAIAKFDLFERHPSSLQQKLISQFSASICRVRLWRSELLM